MFLIDLKEHDYLLDFLHILMVISIWLYSQYGLDKHLNTPHHLDQKPSPSGDDSCYHGYFSFLVVCSNSMTSSNQVMVSSNNPI